MKSPEEIMAQIQAMKKDKPPRWRHKIKWLFLELEKALDPYAIHVRESNEMAGRSAHTKSAPDYDDMHDRSFP